MSKASLIIFVLFTVLETPVYSQASGRMETDRPDQTKSPYIVANGFFQIESGFNKNYVFRQHEYYLPTTLLKYGVKNKFEFRYVFLVNYALK